MLHKDLPSSYLNRSGNGPTSLFSLPSPGPITKYVTYLAGLTLGHVQAAIQLIDIIKGVIRRGFLTHVVEPECDPAVDAV